MSNLSKRVEKAKKLVYSHSPRNPGHYGTWGNSNGEQYYNIELSHELKTVKIETLDGKEKKDVMILFADCKMDTGSGRLEPCPDCKYNNAICKHSLGALRESFGFINKSIKFYDTYAWACKLAFGGKIAKVRSVQGDGVAWAIISDLPKVRKPVQEATYTDSTSDILDAKTNINLMRGNEDEEGID